MRFGGLIAAIAFAAVAAVVVLRMTAKPPAPASAAAQQVAAPQLKTVNVYVASKPIPIGTPLTADMLAIQPWPEHLVLDGFVPSDDAANVVVGMVSRAPFQAQEPILRTKLANPNDPNFLAGDLPKGMRVITIQTNEVEGIAGFVFPGDRVDVILTHEIEKRQSPAALAANPAAANSNDRPEPVTETLLTNVKVLAVDQRATAAGSTDKDGRLVIPRSVSLMVSPADAQRIRLGAKVGTLTLSLRSLADRDDTTDPMIVTKSTDISQEKSSATDDGAAANASGITILRGAPKDKPSEQQFDQSTVLRGAPTAAAAPATTPAVRAVP